jgi:RNA ligase
MKLENLLNIDNLNRLVTERYIAVRKHPSLPLRIYNYTSECMFKNMWPYEVCVCRGLIVDDKDNIVSRPIPKFFNLGQSGPYIFRNAQGNLEVRDEVFSDRFLVETSEFLHAPLSITRKLDGWAGISWNYEDKWGVASRGSFDSPGALYATEKFQKFVKYTAVEFIPKDTTLFFEIISKETRVVVPYDFEGLVLIAAIDNDTGEEMRRSGVEALYKEINQYAKERPWCRLVEDFPMRSLAKCMTDDSMTEEGYVVAIHRNGLPPVRSKIKLAEYCRLHRILCGVTPQKIWLELADPMSSWVNHGSKKDWKTGEIKHDMQIPREFADWVLDWHKRITESFHQNLVDALRVEKAFADMRTDEMAWKEIQDNWEYLRTAGGYSKEIVKVASKLHGGKVTEAYADLWNLVRPFGREEAAFYSEGQGE